MDLKEIQDIVNNVLYKEPLAHTELFGYITTIPLNTLGYLGIIPYENWRVVAVGFTVLTGSIAAQDPEVEFGITKSDIGDTDTDYFGSATVFSEGGAAVMTTGDVWIKDDAHFLQAPDAFAAASDGVDVTWDAGAGHLMEWQTKVAILSVRRPNDHQLTIIPFFLVEVKG